MASVLKLGLFSFFVLLHAFLLLPNSVLSDSDDETTLLQGLNSYRQTKRLPAFIKNGKADCLADQIAGDMEGRPCTSFGPGAAAAAQDVTQLADYPKHLKKCKIEVGTTTDGVVLPVCVPKLVPTLVLQNYTQTSHAQYLNSTKFSGAGLGSEDDWMVLVLSTTTRSGSFTGKAVALVPSVSFGGLVLLGIILISLLVVS